MNVNNPLANSSYIDAKRASDYAVAKVPRSNKFQGLFSAPVFFQYMSDILEPNYSYFAEASVSPAKYALFQVLGYKLMSLVDIAPLCISGSSLLPISSAKVGVLGGAVVGFFYLTLLCTRRHIPQDDSWEVYASCWTYALIIVKEILCSVVAAVIGAALIGLDARDMPTIVIAGILGPIMLFPIMLGTVGITLPVVWSAQWLKDRCTD